MSLASRARYWFPVLPLLGLLGATYWLDQQVQPEVAKPDNKKRHDPDAIMSNFSATKLGREGTPRFVLAATQMLHFSDDDSTELVLPRLVTLSPDHPPIYTRAQRGTVSRKGDEMFLHDQVKVTREASADQREMTLLTEYLRIVPDRDWVATDQAVTLLSPGNTVHAVGMEMDNKAHTLKLLAQVRSEHVPTKK
jgi:lipopolysaccharide export system protein LptC